MNNIVAPSRSRLITFYVLAGLMTALTAVQMIAHLMEDSVSPDQIHSLAHALVSIAILVAVGSQLWRPEQRIAGIHQLAALAIAIATADVLSARFGGLEVILVVFLGVLAFLHPARRELLRLGPARLRTLAFASLACGPLVLYGLGQAGLQRAGFDAAHADLGHWSWMAGLALVIGLLAVLAAIVPSGRRIPGYTAAATMVAFSVGSLMFAAEPSAIPGAWALVGIIGSLAFLAVLETDHSSALTVRSATPIST